MYTRASLPDILARKSARVGQVGGLVGEDRRACSARGKLAERGSRRGHADFRETILRVGVGPMECKLIGFIPPNRPI